MPDVTYLAALFAGLISFLSPCVLPLVPPYLVYMAGASLERLADEEPEPRVRKETAIAAGLFVAGFSTVFIALGASATLIGSVLRAYSERCAISGIKLINGNGRAEVAAAHIRPVEANGPDIVNNGIALSGTVHWMFDRGLISLTDELQVLVSRQANDAEAIRSLINKTGHAFAPERSSDRPHPTFLQWHRKHCFKH